MHHIQKQRESRTCPHILRASIGFPCVRFERRTCIQYGARRALQPAAHMETCYYHRSPLGVCSFASARLAGNVLSLHSMCLLVSVSCLATTSNGTFVCVACLPVPCQRIGAILVALVMPGFAYDIVGRGQKSFGLIWCVGNLLVSMMMLMKLKMNMQINMAWI